MHADDVVPGLRVRYPRTGTTGTVQRIEVIRGTRFAELDSTRLMYRTDQLILAEAADKTRQAVVEDAKRTIQKEREYAAGSELQEALKNIDQSCEGGG